MEIMRKQQKGFSLIELLIVVANILTIAAISTPYLMSARTAANDSSAAKSERTIVTGELAYFAAYPTVGYASLAALGGASPCTPAPATGCLIENNLAQNGTPANSGISGYQFAATAVTGLNSKIPNKFLTTAYPLSTQTGTQSYCAVDDGVIRTQAPGTITVVASYTACQALNPMAN
jgi:prepilin-type N-terminal cleavage/methylation domain-containing protein